MSDKICLMLTRCSHYYNTYIVTMIHYEVSDGGVSKRLREGDTSETGSTPVIPRG
jgi:hypothetical protein